MNALEKQKLTLLTHSKNMMNAVLAEDWQRFSELDSVWQSQLKTAVDTYGAQLDSIGEQLLKDNEAIQKKIKQAQAQLASQLQKSTQSHTSVKQYLK